MRIDNLKGRVLGLGARKKEDYLYEIVAAEIQQGEKDPVAWTRAIESTRGDQTKLQAAYIKNRVRRLRDEILISDREVRPTESVLEHQRAEKEKPTKKERENQRLLHKAEFQTHEDLTPKPTDGSHIDLRPMIIGVMIIALLIFL